MERVTSWHFEKISTVRLKLHRLWWGSAAWKQLRVPPLSPSRPRVVNLNEDDFPSVVCKSALTPHALSLSRKKHSTKMGTRWMRERERDKEEEEVLERDRKKRGRWMHRNASSISSAMDYAPLCLCFMCSTARWASTRSFFFYFLYQLCALKWNLIFFFIKFGLLSFLTRWMLWSWEP